MGGVKQIGGGGFNFLAMLFLGGSERSREHLRTKVDDGTDAGFEFEAVPEENVGFVDS